MELFTKELQEKVRRCGMDIAATDKLAKETVFAMIKELIDVCDQAYTKGCNDTLAAQESPADPPAEENTAPDADKKPAEVLADPPAKPEQPGDETETKAPVEEPEQPPVNPATDYSHAHKEPGLTECGLKIVPGMQIMPPANVNCPQCLQMIESAKHNTN